MKNKKITNITLAKFLDVTTATIVNYKNNYRIFIDFFYKYFSENDIKEFLKTEKIEKFELTKNMSKDEIEIALINHIFFKIERLKEVDKRVLRYSLKYSIAENLEIEKSVNKASSTLKFLKQLKEIFFNKSDDFLTQQHFREFRKKFKNEFKNFEKEIIDNNREKILIFLNEII